MYDISEIWQGRFAVAVAPSTDKIKKNGFGVLERVGLAKIVY